MTAFALDRTEKEFRELKTLKAIANEYDSLTKVNNHGEASLLLAVVYGTQEDVEIMKGLILEHRRDTSSNSAYMEQGERTCPFYKKFKEARNKFLKS